MLENIWLMSLIFRSFTRTIWHYYSQLPEEQIGYHFAYCVPRPQVRGKRNPNNIQLTKVKLNPKCY
jgi:hypothetical protein